MTLKFNQLKSTVQQKGDGMIYLTPLAQEEHKAAGMGCLQLLHPHYFETLLIYTWFDFHSHTLCFLKCKKNEVKLSSTADEVVDKKVAWCQLYQSVFDISKLLEQNNCWSVPTKMGSKIFLISYFNKLQGRILFYEDI